MPIAAAADPPIATAADPLGRTDVPKPRVSKVKAITSLGGKKALAQVAKNKKTNQAQAERARSERRASWPTASKSARDVSAKQTAGSVVSVTVAKPDRKSRGAVAAAAGKASVNVLDQKTARKAGITGVLFTAATDQPGKAKIAVDYSSFASAVGGNWSTRLGLVRLPACVTTTPQKAACRTATPVPSTNDLGKQTVSAPVTLAPAASGGSRSTSSGAPMVMALAATTTTSGNGAGDFKATPLSSSSTWEAGASSGSFTWSYPLTVPPAAAGPVPSLALSYDTGSIDGRTANTNNQSSQVGEGFNLTSSYIERKYGSCDDDGQSDKFDQCWKYENASLVLNGKASELVKDDTTGKWRLKNDDASQVTLATGASNGDGNGEHWKVVTGDGTTYTFGLNQLPGADTQRTNSVWTVPVFGDDSGEPGYTKGSTFADRSETQAWRWNLDLVQDVHGNASTYWYTAESNHYAKNGDKTALAPYTRGGYLNEIRYGQRADTLFTGTPSGKVNFSYVERCTAADCSSLNEDTADNWPDVPLDAICTASETDCLAKGPTFFSRKRLTGIDTSVWSTAAEPDAYVAVDSYKLIQEYLDGGDIGNSSDQTLVLKSLQRTGKPGTPITLPPVDFTYHMKPNRVDAPADDILPLHRPRLNTVTSETGAITTVTLSAPQCVRGSKMPAAEDNNALSCYPLYWAPNGGDTPELDWFHKYNVATVTTTDPAGQNEPVENSYTYESPGWHYNDDPFTPDKERTWSNWRGYGKVTSYTGDTAHTQSKTVKLFMQGMHGDKLKGTTTTRAAVVRGIDLPGLDVGDVNDLDPYAGFERQQITYNGSTPISTTVSDSWSKETASQQKSYANTKAHFVRTARTSNYTYLTATAAWRRSYTDNVYDDYGMTTQVSAAGDSNKTGDETCARTWYARNDAKGLTNLVSRTRIVASACKDTAGNVITDDKLNLPVSSATRGDVLADTAVVYDNTAATGWSISQSPTLGLPTWSGRAQAYPAALGTADRNPSATTGWQTVAKTTYDTATSKLGRPLTVTNAEGKVTSTSYTPADKGPLTSTIVSSPQLAANGQQHKAYTYLDPTRGLTKRTLDANLKKTEHNYDALGRITGTWLPNRVPGVDTPNAKYEYSVTRTAPPWTSVATLKADGTTYQTSFTILDALLRPLQGQFPSPLGGRILTDTRYDSRGLAYETFADIFDDTTAPNGIYTRAEYGEAPEQTQTAFDGAGRATTSKLLIFGQEKWETTTSYTGDSVATSALQGGTATRTITDALGRTTQTRTYSGATPNDTAYGATLGTAYTSVSHTYTRDGKPSEVTGPDGAKWSYTYDLFGRQITASDPDKGTASTTYTALDQIATTKNSNQDSNNNTLLYAYDELGRKTGQWKSSKTDANKLAVWTFDSILKGLPDTSTRFEGGTTGKAYTKKVTAYDSLGRATSTDLILPSDDPLVTAGAVTATSTYGTAYRLDGTVNNIKEPAAGGLPSEIIGTDYNAYGLPVGLTGISGYLLGVSYSALGEAQQMTLGTSTAAGVKKAYLNNRYEQGTGRLTRSFVTDETHPWMPQDLNYTYDQAGNVTSIQDPATLGGTTKPDYQCFTYDGQRRLTEAWTPRTADCTVTGRTTSNIDGPAPYWTSYTYNTAGQRATETKHDTTTTTTTYCYNQARPHALAATTKTASCTGVADQYKYDSTGNTIQRVENAGGTTSQTLSWNPEGALSKLTEGTASTNYIYDADGELLIRRDIGGETVLYTGTTEVHLKAGKKWANRYYTVADSVLAIRTNESGTAKVSFLAADRHGTSSLALDSSTQAITKRHTTPFGSLRGTPTGAWPDDKSFLGKPADTTTGLTHIGAREYDPTTGQFISVDPVLATHSAQSLNGYSYANNTPVTTSDPSGMCAEVDCPTRGTKPDGTPGKNTTPGRAPVASDGPDDTPPGCYGDCDGYTEIYPGVIVPDTWDGAEVFTDKFLRGVEEHCGRYGFDCLARQQQDPDTSIVAQAKLRLALIMFHVCQGQCPENVSTLPEALSAGALGAAAFGVGKGGGGLGSKPGPRSGGTDLTRGEKVAAAAGVDDLSPALRKNLTRFMKGSPGDAQIPQIIRLPEGAAEFSYKVPGRVPGSYAVYRKRVDAEGVTELSYKTTFLPGGSIAHIKFK
ncbi:RHS repeat-associated core domain-containing protein [Streptomyces sp. SYSU K21746]